MQCKYIIFLVLLSLVCAGAVVGVFSAPAEAETINRLSVAAQVVGTLVALAAGVIALSVADRKPKKVRFDLRCEVEAREDVAPYRKQDMPSNKDLKKVWQQYPDEFCSYKVHFTLTNISGFTLKAPYVGFALPLGARHPHESRDWRATFHSNLFSRPADVYGIEHGQTHTIFNRVLPYWNDGEPVTIWVRMVLNRPVDLKVHLNCDNAEGLTRKVEGVKAPNPSAKAD